MSNNVFTNFLSNKGYGPNLRDYQHASRLYVDSFYANAPKSGFLYFVSLKINPDAVRSSNNNFTDAGLLAKKVDLPKFSIGNEVVNQYNRKTVVQTKLSYTPINIELHDDNSNLTHQLWTDYYRNYYNDSNLTERAFQDTKYGMTNYNYGRYNNGLTQNFITSLELYVLHQGNFTKYTLVNPKIVDWNHDSLDQSEGTKVLQNKMTIAYENVYYDYGEITGSEPEGWTHFYDQTPSPHSIAGNGANDVVYGPTGQSAFDKPGKNRVFGTIRPQAPGALQQLGTILLKNYVNQNGLTRQSAVAYNIAGSVLTASLSSGAGKYASPPSTESQPGVFTLPGGVGINIFKGLNTTVDGKIRANPAAILFPPKG